LRPSAPLVTVFLHVPRFAHVAVRPEEGAGVRGRIAERRIAGELAARVDASHVVGVAPERGSWIGFVQPRAKKHALAERAVVVDHRRHRAVADRIDAEDAADVGVEQAAEVDQRVRGGPHRGVCEAGAVHLAADHAGGVQRVRVAFARGRRQVDERAVRPQRGQEGSLAVGAVDRGHLAARIDGHAVDVQAEIRHVILRRQRVDGGREGCQRGSQQGTGKMDRVMESSLIWNCRRADSPSGTRAADTAASVNAGSSLRGTPRSWDAGPRGRTHPHPGNRDSAIETDSRRHC
jgi:hypothetical protein